jgi:hypothetical protein
MSGLKILGLVSANTKDWRAFEIYIKHISEIAGMVENPAQYFGKTGLILAILRTLKKRINCTKQIMEVTCEILTKYSNHSLRLDIQKYFTSELANSLKPNDRITFIKFCQEIAPNISSRYFSEIFLESFMLILVQERYQSVIISAIKALPDIRQKISEAHTLFKIE